MSSHSGGNGFPSEEHELVFVVLFEIEETIASQSALSDTLDLRHFGWDFRGQIGRAAKGLTMSRGNECRNRISETCQLLPTHKRDTSLA